MVLVKVHLRPSQANAHPQASVLLSKSAKLIVIARKPLLVCKESVFPCPLVEASAVTNLDVPKDKLVPRRMAPLAERATMAPIAAPAVWR